MNHKSGIFREVLIFAISSGVKGAPLWPFDLFLKWAIQDPLCPFVLTLLRYYTYFYTSQLLISRPSICLLCGWEVAINGWGIRVAATPRDRKRRLNGFEYLESLISSRWGGFDFWCCFQYETPEGKPKPNFLFLRAIWPKLCWCSVKPN
jgi:hypothetical protein